MGGLRSPVVPGGKKQIEVDLVPVGLKLPTGIHEEMVRLIRSSRMWRDRQEFISEAIREKIERLRLQRPTLHPASNHVVERTKVL